MEAAQACVERSHYLGIKVVWSLGLGFSGFGVSGLVVRVWRLGRVFFWVWGLGPSSGLVFRASVFWGALGNRVWGVELWLSGLGCKAGVLGFRAFAGLGLVA